jgi:hypothetical protein
MRHTMRRTQGHRLSSWLSWAAALALCASVATGCDEGTVVVPGENEANDQDNQENSHNDHNHGHPYDDQYAVDHGPDDDEELVEPGVLNGSWRAARAADDAPLAYFDIFHDVGATTGTGNFLMGMAMGELLMGTAGDLADVEFGVESIVIAWNPTTDDEEMYWVTLTVVDEDNFEGTFEAEKNPASFGVTVERRIVDEESEPFEH